MSNAIHIAAAGNTFAPAHSVACDDYLRPTRRPPEPIVFFTRPRAREWVKR